MEGGSLGENVLSRTRCTKSFKVYFKVTIPCGGKAAHERVTGNRAKVARLPYPRKREKRAIVGAAVVDTEMADKERDKK